MPSGNPFSDAYVIDFEDEYSPTTTDQVLETTISQKAIVTVPILDTLPHLEPWSPRSATSLSSAFSSSPQSSLTPSNWTNENLSKLPFQFYTFTTNKTQCTSYPVSTQTSP
jgi:hypothetical protein